MAFFAFVYFTVAHILLVPITVFCCAMAAVIPAIPTVTAFTADLIAFARARMTVFTMHLFPAFKTPSAAFLANAVIFKISPRLILVPLTVPYDYVSSAPRTGFLDIVTSGMFHSVFNSSRSDAHGTPACELQAVQHVRYAAAQRQNTQNYAKYSLLPPRFHKKPPLFLL